MKKLLIIFLIVNAFAVNKSYSIIFTNCKAWSYAYFLEGKDTIVTVAWSGKCDADGFATGQGIALYGDKSNENNYVFIGVMEKGKPIDGKHAFTDMLYPDERNYSMSMVWKNGNINGPCAVVYTNKTTVGDVPMVHHFIGNFVNGKPSGSFICYDENDKEIGKIFSSKVMEVWKKYFLN